MYLFCSWSSTNAYTFFLFFLNSKYTFFFSGTNPSFNSIAWSDSFLVDILFNFSFQNTFFYLQNLLGTNSSTVFLSSIFLTCLFSYVFCFLFSHISWYHIIFTFSFSQSISRLWVANYSIPNIISIFPRLHTSIYALSTCPLRNILYST